jgi:hypothetical protein
MLNKAMVLVVATVELEMMPELARLLRWRAPTPNEAEVTCESETAHQPEV